MKLTPEYITAEMELALQKGQHTRSHPNITMPEMVLSWAAQSGTLEGILRGVLAHGLAAPVTF